MSAAYDNGYEAGKRDTQRDALATVAALVNQLGGEARIPMNDLMEDHMIERFDDPRTREVVLKVIT